MAATSTLEEADVEEKRDVAEEVAESVAVAPKLWLARLGAAKTVGKLELAREILCQVMADQGRKEGTHDQEMLDPEVVKVSRV